MRWIRNLFGLFSNGKRTTHFPDTFTLTLEHKLTTLCQWVREQSEAGKHVLVLSHFQSTFLENQQALSDAGINFDIIASSTDADSLDASGRMESGKVSLTMSQILLATEHDNSMSQRREATNSSSNIGRADESFRSASNLSVIITERYPLKYLDEQVDLFLSECHAHVSAGYLISFEDPLLKALMDERMVNLLKQLGLGDNDLVTSSMTGRAMGRHLAKISAHVTQENKAASPGEWINKNLPDHPDKS